jgi:diguanylate cyclase (GGDEF)-like protein
VGNDVLRIIGSRFSNFSRSNDLYFRIGGDEFAALMFFDNDYQNGAEKVCLRILELIEQPIAFKATHLDVSISIGMSFYPHDSEHGEELVSIADKNMYIAKKNKLGFVPSKKSANVVVMDTNRPKN